jgi:glycerol-3-phosphate cytidylyltransferase-like family protein
MRLYDLFENENSNLVVIYPGRFHPFHIGHGKVYQYLKKQFPGAKVYIASSNKTDAHKSPFAFDEKKKMMMLAGVDPNAIVQTKVPYVASEITDRFDPDNTIVVYAVSEKDMLEDPRFDFPQNGLKMKKNGEPAHVQKWPGVKNAKPLRDHSYVVTTPTFTFSIQGEAINSATQIRNMIAHADEKELVKILQDLYGRNDIPREVISLFQKKLGPNTVSENWEEDCAFELLLEAEIIWDLRILREGKVSNRGASRKKELEFHKKLDRLVHDTFGTRPGELDERELSKKEIKKRDKYADDLPDAEFKKRYGKDWEAVKYGTATNMVKRKSEGTEMKISDIVNEAKGPCWKGYQQIGMKNKNGKKVPNCVPVSENEITVENADEIYGTFDDAIFEAEYQGRDVPLNKPMQGDVKKFKVYVKNEKGNVVKVNFGDPDMKIKKSNPARRKSFRARHNCDNPGPKTKARYWSCRKW